MSEKKKKPTSAQEKKPAIETAEAATTEKNGQAESGDLSQVIEELKKQAAESKELSDELKTRADEFKDKWYRTAAEFENFKKRNAETRKNAYEEGKTDAIKKILFIGDNLERALSYELDEKTKEGLLMILRQYKEVLGGLGLEEIDPTGMPFDPNLHEAIFTKPCEEGQDSDTVESVFLKGYKMGDKIIRYAQVVVIK